MTVAYKYSKTPMHTVWELYWLGEYKTHFDRVLLKFLLNFNATLLLTLIYHTGFSCVIVQHREEWKIIAFADSNLSTELPGQSNLKQSCALKQKISYIIDKLSIQLNFYMCIKMTNMHWLIAYVRVVEGWREGRMTRTPLRPPDLPWSWLQKAWLSSCISSVQAGLPTRSLSLCCLEGFRCCSGQTTKKNH